MKVLRIFRAYCASCEREITDVDHDDPGLATVECPSCGDALPWRAAETIETL